MMRKKREEWETTYRVVHYVGNKVGLIYDLGFTSATVAGGTFQINVNPTQFTKLVGHPV